jgi:hypothetical protein
MLGEHGDSKLMLLYDNDAEGVLWQISCHDEPAFHWVLKRNAENEPKEVYVIDTATSLKMPRASDILRYIEMRFEKKP